MVPNSLESGICCEHTNLIYFLTSNLNSVEQFLHLFQVYELCTRISLECMSKQHSRVCRINLYKIVILLLFFVVVVLLPAG